MDHPSATRRRRAVAALAALALGVAGAAAGGAAQGAASAATGDLTQQAHDAALPAYVIGYPLVVMRRTEAVQTCATGVNTLHHAARLFTSADRDVVTPNNDTIYSMAWLDLRPGPQRLSLPPASDRYFSFGFLDMYTGVFDVAHGVPGTRSDVYVVGPDWHGTAPAGVRVVHSPTNDVWAIGRTFVNGPADLDAAKAFQQGYHLSGPAGTPVVPPGTDCSTLPTPQSVDTEGAGFFDELDAMLRADPPTKDERTQLKALYRLGHAGHLPGAGSDPAIVAGMESAIHDAQAQIDARARTRENVANGWSWSLGHGVWGTDYLRRAMVTKYGLGALPASEAIYYRAATDTSGAPLTGATTYRLHLAADQLPPAGAFWSVTMYDAASRMLVDNPINRYAFNSASPDLVRNADGSIDITIQNAAPTSPDANWLPAPAGAYYLILRVYVPQQAALDGSWTPPALQAG